MRYQTHDKGTGPRLEGTSGSVILPDFAFYDKFKGKCLLDVKHKTKNYILTDDGFRVLILAKAFSNICDGSIPAINRTLTMLFGQTGKCYCTDLGGMAMTYTFEFVPNPVQLAVLTQSGVMPTPTGVSYTIVYPGS